MLTILLVRQPRRLPKWILPVLDAVGLAVFVGIGVNKACLLYTSVLGLSFQVFQTFDGLTNGFPVSQHTAQPAMVHEELVAADVYKRQYLTL